MSLGQNDNAILKLLADEELRKENAALAAENERLRKAGDAMAKKLFENCAPWQFAGVIKFKGQEVVAAWNAAKEGRDAK